MQHIYRRIMGLYKGDCERLRILCREHLLSSSRSKEAESGLRCRLLAHFPLFVEYSENRPAIKKRAKIEKDQSILENYDLAFYKKCSAAYSFLTPNKVDIYYEEELRCVIPNDIRDLFGKSAECQRCVKIGPAVPNKMHPKMQQIDDKLVDAVIKAVQRLQKDITSTSPQGRTKE